MNPNEELFRPNMPIPSGWRRVQLGEKIEVDDMLTYHAGGTENLSAWTRVMKDVVGNEVHAGNTAIIRKVEAPWKEKNEIRYPDAPIPQGWQCLKVGEAFKKGDRFSWAEKPSPVAENWVLVPASWCEGAKLEAKDAIIIRKVETQIDGIPEGWYRLPLWAVLEEGDRFHHTIEYPRRAEDWYPVRSHELEKKTTVVPGGAACIRKIKNQAETNDAVVSVAVMKYNIKEEKKTMSKINQSTLTALLTLRAGEPTETLPGVEGEGVFAQALKDAELKRRETALKALTEVAIEIQNAFAAAKEAQRAEIRRAQAVIETAKTRLNVLDAAAEPLKSANPNPFPVLNELGMVNRHDLGLSVDEFVKLVAVPGVKN